MLKVEGSLTTQDLAEAAKREPVARVSRRILAVRDVLLRGEGSCPDVAESFAVDERTVQRWIHDYNAGGIEALRDAARPGQPKKLPSEREEEFRRRILAGPSADEGLSAYRGTDARRILHDEFGADYCPSAVYVVLHRLGLSSLMPRPEHPGADPQAREAFKKTPGRA
jgi:transposase